MPRRIPASLTREYNRAIKSQGDAAKRSVRAALTDYMRENPDASVAELRDYAAYLLQSAGDLYGNACSQAALELQDTIAEMYGTKPPDVGGWLYEPDAESIEKTARYHAGKLAEGDTKGFIDQIADAARFYAERGANSTMAQTARRQASARGRRGTRSGAEIPGVLFARVPSGATTCPFCLMLASRGFVYLSKESAGEFDRFHRHCDCRIVPGYPGMELEGYDPDEYYDMWKHPERYNGDVRGNAALRQETKTVKVPKEYENNYDDFIPLDISHETKTHLAQLHKLAQENGFEYAQIIHDGNPGDIITSEDPNGVKVEITEEDGFGLSLLHSHTNETPLSRKDFRYFCNDQVDYVENIAINGDIFLASVGNGWRPTLEEFDRIVSQIAKEVDFDVMQMPEYGSWSPKERNYVAIREQTYRIARYFEWDLMGGNIYGQTE